jgi:hypothetical protein
MLCASATAGAYATKQKEYLHEFDGSFEDGPVRRLYFADMDFGDTGAAVLLDLVAGGRPIDDMS